MTPEPDWTDAPPQTHAGHKAEIWRCGIGAFPPVIALSPRHSAVELHYWRRRSFPHTKPTCEACDHGNTAEWKGFIAVWNPANRMTGILEFTPRCWTALDAYFLAHGTCRGAAIHLKRAGKRDNGALSMECTPSKWGIDQLPAAFDVKPILIAIWGSKRQTATTPTAPARPIIEPPTTQKEVENARFARDLRASDLTQHDTMMSIGDVAAMLAARATSIPAKPNGSHLEP